ncbi:MAG TPA: hypothetical protein VHR66_28370 [Gemmataceae bacterium]|jgi:hypothetical protein|nr:hypothetical protein [Gemmataceae bacterium]
MRGIRRWLTSAALLTGTTVFAQAPKLPASPEPEPPIAAALPGGAVVGTQRTSTASVSVLTPATKGLVLPPAVASPIDSPAPTVLDVAPPPASVAADASVGPIPAPSAVAQPVSGCAAPTGDCCGPVGAHGPIGQDVYLRVGPTFALGHGLLAKGLDIGVMGQFGARSLFFNPAGDSAWVLDGHVIYTYNNATGNDVATVRQEPVTVRALHRSAIGLGIGRDHFLAGPGFVGGIWDANLSYGWDAGARWGAGHVDLNPVLESGYRRNYDVFGQPFVGLHAELNIPVGAYTCIMGGRLEWDYTFSDILPKQGSFQEISALFEIGVRY